VRSVLGPWCTSGVAEQGIYRKGRQYTCHYVHEHGRGKSCPVHTENTQVLVRQGEKLGLV